MTFRIAPISFLNTWPLVEPLRDLPPGEVELTFDLPSRLPDLLASGAADAALIPAVEYLRGAGAAIVPGVAIGSVGPVDSVKLFYRGPLASLRRIAVDRGSRTSVALMRVLLGEMCGIDPERTALEPDPADPLAGQDAALIIGDRCFEAERTLRESGRDDVRRLDLAAAWRDLTGKPFVFAVWTVSEAFLASASSAERDALTALLRDAARGGMDAMPRLASRAVAEGLLGVGGVSTVDAVSRYFRESLDYDLGEEQLAGLRLFRDMAAARGLCPLGRRLVLLPGA